MKDRAVLEQGVFDLYGPQLGEILWYEFNVDPRVDSVSRARLPEFKRIMKEHGCAKVLELAPFAHFTGHILAEHHEVVLCDISARSLEIGADLATKQGIPARAMMVSADFHDLPFPEGSFDLVFIASAIHHTRRPGRVLAEIDRVLCRGGVAYIFNEPVQRHFSFYKFRANRKGELSQSEKALEDRGVLRLVTSYLAHSRPEELFGMTENNQIPLATYFDALQRYDRLDLRLDWQSAMSEFDKKVLAYAESTPDPAPGIAAMIREKLAGIEPSTTETLRGIQLPSNDEIDLLARNVAERFARLAIQDRNEVLAEVFGAALRLVAKKKDGPPLTRGIPVRSDFVSVRGVYRKDTFEIPGMGLRLDVNASVGPIIQTAEADELGQTFPSEAWQRVLSERGIVSMLPRIHEPVIRVQPKSLAAVLVRFFANLPDGVPYVLSISTNTGEALRLTIAAPESRLARFIAEDVSQIRFSALTLEGASREGPPPIRIMAIQVVELFRSVEATTA